MKKCILVQTKNGRRFLVKERYLNQIKELIKIYKLEVYRAETEDEVLNLSQLIEQFCESHITDPNYKKLKKLS